MSYFSFFQEGVRFVLSLKGRISAIGFPCLNTCILSPFSTAENKDEASFLNSVKVTLIILLTINVHIVTSKGQIIFPKAIRDQLGLEAGDKLEFTIIENRQLLIIPKKASVKALKGMLPKPKNSISLEEMESAIARGEKG